MGSFHELRGFPSLAMVSTHFYLQLFMYFEDFIINLRHPVTSVRLWHGTVGHLIFSRRISISDGIKINSLELGM